MNIVRFQTLESTNETAKELAKQGAEEFTAVIAENQTKGKGRIGKSFFSPAGGLYLSIILRPQRKASDTLDITTAASVAVLHVLERRFNVKVDIKWVNDLYKDGRKICGILTEAALRNDGTAEWIILGIGINLYPSSPVPKELEEIMGFVCDAPTDIDKTMLASEIIKEFQGVYSRLDEKEFYNEYKSRMFLCGKEITVITPQGEKKALVLGLDDALGLIVKYEDGKEETLIAGEVSIKL